MAVIIEKPVIFLTSIIWAGGDIFGCYYWEASDIFGSYYWEADDIFGSYYWEASDILYPYVASIYLINKH